MSRILTHFQVEDSELQQLETHISVNINEFLNFNLSYTLGFFFRHNYLPEAVLKEVLKLNRLTTFSKTGIFPLLDTLIDKRVQDQGELYKKLFDRLIEVSPREGLGFARKFMQILSNYNEAYPECNEETQENMQVVVDHFSRNLRMRNSSG